MKRKLIYLIAGLTLIALSAYHKAGPGGTALVYDRSVKAEYGRPIKVLKAVDGDTVELMNGERLRYVGIDTPEEVDPRKPVQCYAKEAAEENRKLVEGKYITFYKDISGQDKYGRWLGYVYLSDGTFVNLELVKGGFAFAYKYAPDTSKSEQFSSAELSAKTANLGLWANCEVKKLSTGREQTNNL